MTNIYVGNLPFQATEEELKGMFGAYGAVEGVNIIVDKMSGRSRGFGFVEMTDATAAQAAIQALNGADMSGRALTVNEAKPKTENRSGGGARSGGYRSGGGGRDRY